MEYRTLGKTGLRVSGLGFGGIPIQRIDAEGTRVLMQELLKAGINYIDTARGYTVSEEYLGYGLEGIREHFVLATKGRAHTKSEMLSDIATSLKNLRTDYIDLYQFHNPSASELEEILAPGGALEGALEAKNAGLIRHIGITTHSAELFARVLDYDWVETVMFPYNIVETQGEALIQKAAERNIGFVCMKPLAGGAIEDAPLAIRYIKNNPAVSVIIPGMADPAELKQNIAAFESTVPFSRFDEVRAEAVRRRLGTSFCRRCNYCAPCSVGISIPNVFLMEGYLSRYGLEGWARSRYDVMGKHASDCIECGACEGRCPYNLPIRRMLKEAAKKFGK